MAELLGVSQAEVSKTERRAALREGGGVGECLPDILFFKIREVGEEVSDRPSGGESLNNHSDGDSHAPNAGLSAHHVGIGRDALKVLHWPRIAGTARGRRCSGLCGCVVSSVRVGYGRCGRA
jgi:hypothetical protein